MNVRFAGCSPQTVNITLSSTPYRQLENQAPMTTGGNQLYNTLELLMMGITVPETCWASNKICNKKHLLHLVSILYRHINDKRSKSLQIGIKYFTDFIKHLLEHVHIRMGIKGQANVNIWRAAYDKQSGSCYECSSHQNPQRTLHSPDRGYWQNACTFRYRWLSVLAVLQITQIQHVHVLRSHRNWKWKIKYSSYTHLWSYPA
jgi:hypothetical protein